MADVEEGEEDVTSPPSFTTATSAVSGAVVPPTSQNRMTKISRHNFSDSNDPSSDCDFSIDIVENIQEEYGMFVWPCAIVLAEYVWQQRSRFLNEPVVELGAGTALPGLAAAKVGADVTLTDDSSNLEVLDNMRRTCSINGLNCKILGLTWGEWDAPLLSLKPRFVLGPTYFDDLFATVTALLMRSSTAGCVFITAYHNRSGHHLIEYLMAKWGWKCTKLVDAFSFMPPSKASKLQGSIQLVEIRLNDEDPEQEDVRTASLG
ncbi:unnamed protein product [Spirodela intermedia]|uniref:Uncharacterized protein n=1 Tax=Spirodela intermedia TaxID=51605 RepID=A0A7I8IDZ4_SPIIN|nr:unnamed protein product [Spirodela intermedia]CAA6656010.1 unnamed protein product [Spirodela intermedia]